MMLIRSAKDTDLDAIFALSLGSGVGIASLPKSRELLETRLSASIDAFNKHIEKPENEYYLFVLEDDETGEVVGTSAIQTNLGHDSPVHSYKITKRVHVCRSLSIRPEHEILTLANDHQGTNELCTLYLAPNYRHHGNATLLSKARFMFMAEHTHRFSSRVIAEIKGVTNKSGYSPFWGNLGANFFLMNLSEAEELFISTNKQFITDLMPVNPIYVNLLPKTAQAVIGQPHHKSRTGMMLLKREGFTFNNYVDIFDAGPILECSLSNIKTISLSHVLVVNHIRDTVSNAKRLISNMDKDFRATISEIKCNFAYKTCTINGQTARKLQIGIGDFVRVAPLIKAKPSETWV